MNLYTSKIGQFILSINSFHIIEKGRDKIYDVWLSFR